MILNSSSCLLALLLSYTLADDLVVYLKDGPVRGKEVKSRTSNSTYLSFEGIPYAKPPVGDLRFQPPEDPVKWSEILETTALKTQCMQFGGGAEDCLYLNVYSPKSDEKKAVMVFIYGGAFHFGSPGADIYGPDLFLDKEVVLVTFNYRMGLFGFITTGDAAAPGNVGIKDAVKVLEWIQANIASFGGDPNRVTIFGVSSGSMTVSYLLQSKLAAGLVHGGIMESGTSLCLWSLSLDTLNATYAVADVLGIKTNNSFEMIQALKQVKADDLLTTSELVSNTFFFSNALRNRIFAPYPEPESEQALFTKSSYEILKSGEINKVPALIGFNSNEGRWLLTNYPFTALAFLYDLDHRKLIPFDMNVSEEKEQEVAEIIKEEYFNKDLIMFQTENKIRFFGDDQFVRPIRETVRLQSKHVPVYYYKFSYEGLLGAKFEGVTDRTTIPGVGHAEEMAYIFRMAFEDDIETIPEDDLKVRHYLLTLWTNFAKHRNPTPFEDPSLQNITWSKVDPSSPDLAYINIDIDLSMDVNPNNQTIKFYDELYSKYGNPPFNTY